MEIRKFPKNWNIIKFAKNWCKMDENLWKHIIIISASFSVWIFEKCERKFWKINVSVGENLKIWKINEKFAKSLIIISEATVLIKLSGEVREKVSIDEYFTRRKFENLKDSWKIRKNFIIISKVAFNYFHPFFRDSRNTREILGGLNIQIDENLQISRTHEKFAKTSPNFFYLDAWFLLFFFFFKDIVKFRSNPNWIF